MGPRLAPLLEAILPPFAAVVVVTAAYAHGHNPVRPLGLALSIAAALTLAGRRRFPGRTVAVTAAFALATLAVDRDIAPYTLLIPAAALFSVALFGTWRRHLSGGIAAAAVVVLAEVVNENRPGLVTTVVWHLAPLAVPILAAEALRTRRDYRTAIRERLALVKLTREQEARRRVQDERLSIARDLHDVVAHTLTTVHVQASVARHLLDSRPEQARHALAVIEEASRDGIAELRSILGVLRDPEDVAAAHAPAPGVDDLPDLVQVAQDAGLRAEFAVSGARPTRLPQGVSRAAYRIVQESLTNAARHTTTGARVHVELTFGSDELAIAVKNTTAPPAHSANGNSQRRRSATFAPKTPRVGILGMTERAHALGGTLNATATDTGFLVAARLPYSPR